MQNRKQKVDNTGATVVKKRGPEGYVCAPMDMDPFLFAFARKYNRDKYDKRMEQESADKRSNAKK